MWHIKHTTSGRFPWDPLDDSFLKLLGYDIPLFCFQTKVLIEFLSDLTQSFLALYLICLSKLGTRYPRNVDLVPSFLVSNNGLVEFGVNPIDHLLHGLPHQAHQDYTTSGSGSHLCNTCTHR